MGNGQQTGTWQALTTVRARIGAIVLLCMVQYVVCEAIVAAAWTRFPYSYANNYISDLGVPGCTQLPARAVCSPLAELMNASFIAHGLLVFVALWAFAGIFTRGWRWVVIIIGIIHAVGLILVGSFHGSFAEDLGGGPVVMLFHSLGALLGIAGGNVLAIVVGAALFRRARGYALFAIGCGVLGFLPLPLQGVLTPVLGAGGVERALVYPFIVWLLASGVLVLMARRRLRVGGRAEARA